MTSLDNLKKAAEIHIKVRNECRPYIKTNAKYSDIVKLYENTIDKYCNDELNNTTLVNDKSGIAFPIGFSVNNVCAHDSTYLNDNRILNKNDILKIDIGIHYNGYIIDSAQTIIVDNDINNMDTKTQNLINSTIDATNTAIKNSGVDVRLYELSEKIYETLSSYDEIKPIWALGGHNIKQYQIHGGKLILCKPHEIQQNIKMEEDEIYAIETFASTGTGYLMNLDNVTHYKQNKFDNKSKKFMKHMICKDYIINRNGLPFNNRWIVEQLNNNDKVIKELNTLVNSRMFEQYPPLSDMDRNAKTSQLEHTIYVKESGVINLSKFDDY